MGITGITALQRYALKQNTIANTTNYETISDKFKHRRNYKINLAYRLEKVSPQQTVRHKVNWQPLTRLASSSSLIQYELW